MREREGCEGELWDEGEVRVDERERSREEEEVRGV